MCLILCSTISITLTAISIYGILLLEHVLYRSMIKKLVKLFKKSNPNTLSTPLLRGDHLLTDLTEEEEEAVIGGPPYPLSQYGYRPYHSTLPLFGITNITKPRRNGIRCFSPSLYRYWSPFHHWHW